MTDASVVTDLLGKVSDREVERRTGVSRRVVARMRREAGISPWRPVEPEHGTTARARRGCRCELCAEARAVQAAGEYARSSRATTRGPIPGDRAAELAARRRASLARTARVATRRGRWNATELAVALDMTLTAEQAALQLGRSRSAVEHQRARRASDRTASGPLPRGRRARRAG